VDIVVAPTDDLLTTLDVTHRATAELLDRLLMTRVQRRRAAAEGQPREGSTDDTRRDNAR